VEIDESENDESDSGHDNDIMGGCRINGFKTGLDFFELLIFLYYVNVIYFFLYLFFNKYKCCSFYRFYQKMGNFFLGLKLFVGIILLFSMKSLFSS